MFWVCSIHFRQFCWWTYLPSPPHAPLGVIITSLQRSHCVLYTSSVSAFPSDASISEKKSSDCESSRQCDFTSRFHSYSNAVFDSPIAGKQLLLPATPGLRQQCSPNKASVQPDQQANSVPHPERTIKSIKMN